MQKIKLFMVLALLVAGVGVTWAQQQTQNFTVSYSGLGTSQGAGFSATTGTNISYQDNFGYTYTFQIYSYTQTQIVVRGRYAQTDRDYYTNELASNITPNPVTGYTAEVSVSGTAVTITYTQHEQYISYRVIYEKSLLSGTGYTVNSSAKSFVKTADDADVITFDTYVSGAPTSLTSETVGNYITARLVPGHTTTFYVNEKEAELGYKGNIYINYESNATGTSWNDGVFEYSTIYNRATGSVIELPDREVAISLYMGETETVTDTVAYTADIQYYNTPTNVYRKDGVMIGTVTLNRDGSTSFTPASGPFSDDDGEEVEGETATYSYCGYHANGFGGGTIFFERTHQVKCSKVTSVTIPRTTVGPDGKTYNVTAIQKWGFAYRQNHQMMISHCDDASSGNGLNHESYEDEYFWGCIDDHSNRYLTQVRFEDPSNIKSIGDYAFMSSTELTSIVFPNSLEYLGQGIFEMCYKLNDCRFQTLDDGTVKFKIIKMFTFWLCRGLQSIELPDGITEIEGQQAGAAMQYMTSLINVRLPNTLERIGPHFLCCASSLETLTIPASVTYIDGASFHGCENLRNVYLLGPAAALQKEYTGSGSEQSSSTFSANSTFCKERVNNCTFWVTQDYYNSYKTDPVWSLIDETTFNEDWTEEVSWTGDHNALRQLIQEVREFFAAKWVTAIFPYGVKNYKTEFPAGTRETRVAVMDPDATHKVTTGTDPKSGKSIILYNVVYKLIDGDDIPPQTPVMICPGTTTEYTLFTTQQAATEWFKEEASKDHPTVVEAEDGATITMKGHYVPYKLHPWDFYFMYQPDDLNADGSAKNPAKFYRVPSADKAATVGTCRCYWTINVNNVKANTSMAPAQNAKGYNVFMDEDDVTGIENSEVHVVVEGIYDLNGRKLDIAPEDLQQGVYIVNGKKVVKN